MRLSIIACNKLNINLVQIAGGTGVSPFFQLLHSYFTGAKCNTGIQPRFTLLQSYRSMDDCIPPRFLDKLLSWCQKHSEHLRVFTFVDMAEGNTRSGIVPIERRIIKEDIKTILEKCTGRTVVLVCGPES